VDANLTAFVNVLEGCRHNGVKHLVYASSSSVYGGNTKLPFSEADPVDTPISLYAATKKADELMAHTYSHLFGLPATGLRFFTVYGPWGRPDMAMWKFTEAILAGKPIEVYNRGEMWRDFTYIDDIVEGVVRLAEDLAPGVSPGVTRGPAECTIRATGAASPLYRIYNIGNNRPEKLSDLIAILEQALGKKARKRLLPLQPGDVPRTYADIAALERDYGFRPSTPLREGVRRFVEWYREYHGRKRRARGTTNSQ
jgi:UDP-glucuronate 4-epimerase